MSDTQSDITLVIHGRSVGEFVSLEMHQGRSFGATVLKFAHNFPIKWAALGVDQALLRPAESVADIAARNVHAVNVLIVDGHDHGQGVADLHAFGYPPVHGLTSINLH